MFEGASTVAPILCFLRLLHEFFEECAHLSGTNHRLLLFAEVMTMTKVELPKDVVNVGGSGAGDGEMVVRDWHVVDAVIDEISSAVDEVIRERNTRRVELQCETLRLDVMREIHEAGSGRKGSAR